jgi:hypothetical protein
LSSKQKGGHSYAGRNKVKCAKYLAQHRRIKNKIKKLSHYCKYHQNDISAQKRLDELK